MPTDKQAHVDSMLTDISVAYLQNANNFAADKVFPTVPVQKESDRYFIYNRGDFNRDEMQLRADGTESAGGDYNIDNTPSYFCDTYGFHKDVTARQRANATNPFDPDKAASKYVTQKMLIKREKAWAANYFKTGIWGNETAGVAATPTASQFLQFNDPNSDPISVFAEAADEMGKTGFRPNKLVLGTKVFTALKKHPSILDKIKYTQKGIVTVDLLAALFEVDQVVISRAVVNTAAKGKTEASDYIFGNSALLAYAAPNPGLETPSAGYIFAWNGYLGAGAYGNAIYRVEAPLLGLGTERIEGEMCFDCKMVGKDLGFFFNTAVAD